MTSTNLKMESDQLKVENKKSTKAAEHEKRLSKEFMRALGLLYSPEAKSAEKLRLMLEIEIAKQSRPNKRSRFRTRQRRSKRQKTVVDVVKCEKNSLENGDISGKEVDADCNPESGVEGVGSSRDDIPRISIPDEGQSDGAVCKVCHFPEFGSLTLVQCNACDKCYHPLCHQPPIVEMSSQESNSRWHCGECEKKDESLSNEK